MSALGPVFSVITPASDLTLLTLAELRAAVGIADGSRDDDLKRLGARTADALTQACHLATDGAKPPTLRQESVADTFRLNHWWNCRDYQSRQDRIILSRRPIVSVAAVVEAGVTLDPASYEIRAAEGALLRLFDDAPSSWARTKITVTYAAGWATVPEGLKRAAEKLMRFYWSEASRDPLLRQVNIPGIYERTYWIGAPTDPAIPQDVLDDLGPFTNQLIG